AGTCGRCGEEHVGGRMERRGAGLVALGGAGAAGPRPRLALARPLAAGLVAALPHRRCLRNVRTPPPRLRRSRRHLSAAVGGGAGAVPSLTRRRRGFASSGVRPYTPPPRERPALLSPHR